MDIGVEHESNGRTLPDSRSWNRVYVTPYFPPGHDLFHLKFWYRITESEKQNPQDPRGDDNPDIGDYLGYGEMSYIKRFALGARFGSMVRGNPSTNRCAVCLSYDYPGKSKDVYYRLMVWHGYGKTLINYDRSITRVSIGVSVFR